MGMNEMLKALKGLPAEVKRLLDENGQLVDEVDRLNSELGHTQMSLEEQSDKVKALEEELAHERVTTKSKQRNFQSQIDVLEKEKQQLAEENEALRQRLQEFSEREPQAKESKKAKETIANLQEEVAGMTQKLEAQQQEMDDLKASVENDYVPVAIIEEGLRDYTEETDPEQGHAIYVTLNAVLAGNIPWAKCTRRLRAFFKKARKEYDRLKQSPDITNKFEAGSSANVFNDKVEGKFDNGRTEE
jgi:DNA repair exonuclease SbcCD ATPase subunit